MKSLLVAAACLSPTFAMAEPAPAWVKLPDPAAFARYYPPQALRQRIEGKAMLQCQIGPASGRIAPLVNCQVTDESPSGMGFGAAALSLAPYFGMLARKDPPNAGGVVRIPIVFGLAH